MDLQTDVEQALKIALDVPVVKYLHEYSASHPVVVYQEISNVPAMNADNTEILRRVTFQISIGTNDDEYQNLESTVEEVMRTLDFVRIDSRDIFDEVYWRVIRFVTLANYSEYTQRIYSKEFIQNYDSKRNVAQSLTLDADVERNVL